MSAAVDPPELVCRDLSVRFTAGPAALDQIQTRFAAGRITALIGASGCGKTTLLRVLAGLQAATEGSVQVQPAVAGGRGELAYVFQQPALLPWRTAIENVSLALQLTDSVPPGQSPVELAKHELQQMELPHDAWSRFPRELSGGMKMRVSLARALVTQPRLLLLDEPFAALDDLSRSALGELLWQRWRRRPFTAVLVTHNIAEAVLLSHQIQVMVSGRIHAVIDNPLPVHPASEAGAGEHRQDDLRTTPEFAQVFSQVSAAIWQRSAASTPVLSRSVPSNPERSA